MYLNIKIIIEPTNNLLILILEFTFSYHFSSIFFKYFFIICYRANDYNLCSEAVYLPEVNAFKLTKVKVNESVQLFVFIYTMFSYLLF